MSCIKEASSADDSSGTVTDSEVDGDHKKLILDLQPAERGLKGQTLEADLVLWRRQGLKRHATGAVVFVVG